MTPVPALAPRILVFNRVLSGPVGGGVRKGKGGAKLNADHIPHEPFPELPLDINELQDLLANCNPGKGYPPSTDWR